MQKVVTASARYQEQGRQDALPNVFCWTKMGTEAGQSLDLILHRKELERRAGKGVFGWGIGSSLGSAPDMARRIAPCEEVDVLFTPMKSAPKRVDVAPDQIMVWLSYLSSQKEVKELPEYVLITSRGGSEKRVHYALLCHSDAAINAQSPQLAFNAAEVRNLISDNPVGASQVTSVVRYCGTEVNPVKDYRVTLRAKLHAEGFVRLTQPVILSGSLLSLYHQVCRAQSMAEWRAGVSELKLLATKSSQAFQCQAALF